MSKKHFGFQALYEAEQKVKAKEGHEEPDSQPETGYPVRDRISGTGYPVSETGYPVWISGDEDQTTIQEAKSSNTGYPVNEQTGYPVMKKPDIRSKSDKRIKKQIMVRYNPSVEKEIRDFCTRHKMELQDFHELAVTYYMQAIDDHEVKTPGIRNEGEQGDRISGKQGDRISHDDLMIFKTHDDIIMRYERLTGRKWKPSDDRTATPFNSVDHRLVEIGMIHTYIQAKGKKINSFAYFIPEIQTMIDANFDRSNLDVYLKARRKLLTSWMKKQGKEPITFWDSEEQKQKG